MNLSVLIELVLVFPIILLSLSFHELAHGWVAMRCGDRTALEAGRLSINPLAHIDWIGTFILPCTCILLGFPFVGWAKPVPVDVHRMRRGRRDLSIVAIAGPVSNFILAFCALGILAIAVRVPVQHPWWEYVHVGLVIVIQANLALGMFNLLPIPPLDGFNIIQGALPIRILLPIVRYSSAISLAVMLVAFSGGLAFLAGPIEYVFRSMISLIQ